MDNNTIFLVVEYSLEDESFKNLAVFSSKENAEEFIIKLNKNGDYFEYGITEFIVDNWV